MMRRRLRLDRVSPSVADDHSVERALVARQWQGHLACPAQRRVYARAKRTEQGDMRFVPKHVRARERANGEIEADDRTDSGKHLEGDVSDQAPLDAADLGCRA